MGYLSGQHLNLQASLMDHSYHGFEDQLLWRYEDLRDRYLELLDMEAPASGDDYLGDDDCRYAPVQSFRTLRDVYRAMMIAKDDLVIKCGIVIDEDWGFERNDEKEPDPAQVTVYEIVLLPTWFQTAMAA